MARRAAGCHVCEVCKKTYSSEDVLHQHKLLHSIKCTVCNAVFAQKIQLRFHHRKYHSDAGHFAGDLTCDVCSRTYQTKRQLKCHKLIHLSKKPFKCTKCNKTFAQKGGLVVHIKNKHTKIGRGRSKALVGKALLKNLEMALKCHICDKGFSTNVGLKIHIIRLHQRKAASATDNSRYVLAHYFPINKIWSQVIFQ